jgi:hypothetical protein
MKYNKKKKKKKKFTLEGTKKYDTIENENIKSLYMTIFRVKMRIVPQKAHTK